MTQFTKKLIAKAAILGLAATSLVSTPALAQQQTTEIEKLAPDVQVDLKKVTCWDVVTLNEDDRALVMTMLYGYAVAEKGTSMISPEAVQVAIVLSMTECVEKPDAKVHHILLEKMARRGE